AAETKLIDDVFDSVAGVVNFDFVERGVIKLIIVRTRRRQFTGDVVSDQRHEFLATRLVTTESEEVGTVNRWIHGEQRRLAVARRKRWLGVETHDKTQPQGGRGAKARDCGKKFSGLSLH